jgi:hypothetical protein
MLILQPYVAHSASIQERSLVIVMRLYVSAVGVAGRIEDLRATLREATSGWDAIQWLSLFADAMAGGLLFQ